MFTFVKILSGFLWSMEAKKINTKVKKKKKNQTFEIF